MEALALVDDLDEGELAVERLVQWLVHVRVVLDALHEVRHHLRSAETRRER